MKMFARPEWFDPERRRDVDGPCPWKPAPTQLAAAPPWGIVINIGAPGHPIRCRILMFPETRRVAASIALWYRVAVSRRRRAFRAAADAYPLRRSWPLRRTLHLVHPLNA